MRNTVWPLILFAIIGVTACNQSPQQQTESTGPATTASTSPTTTTSADPVTTASSGPVTTALFGDGKVGNVALGMKIDDAIKLLGKPDRIDDKAYKFLSLGIELDVAEPSKKIVSIFLLGPTYLNDPLYQGLKPYTGKSAKGVGMGSSKEDLVRAYGKPSMEDPFGRGVYTGTYGYFQEQLGFSFGPDGTVCRIRM